GSWKLRAQNLINYGCFCSDEETMGVRSVAGEIEELRRQIEHHNRKYYFEDAPEISDLEFDRLMRRLIELEREHPALVAPDSPTQRVRGDPIEGFKQVVHRTPMLSRGNTYNEADLREFDARLPQRGSRKPQAARSAALRRAAPPFLRPLGRATRRPRCDEPHRFPGADSGLRLHGRAAQHAAGLDRPGPGLLRRPTGIAPRARV